MMCSGQFLEEKVKEFCAANNKDEGQVWQQINNIHTKDFQKDLMQEKNTYEHENNLEDIPMSQWFAKQVIVHRAINILKTLEVEN